MRPALFTFAALLVLTPAANAAAAPNLPEPPRGRADYVAPRIGKDQLDALAKLPDWNGTWIQQAAPKLRPAHLVFDPDNFHEPPDASEGKNGLVSVRPGSYMTAIPYKPEYKEEYDFNVAENAAGRSIDRSALCVPYGMPRLMGGAPSGPEVIMTPTMVVMYFDFGSTVRHIYTDGRKHPEGESFEGGLNLRWNGHSIGHWEGDTLVVDTVGVYPGFYDQTSAPHSDKVRIHERIRLIDWNWLENQMVIEDPEMFSEPWKVTRYYLRNTAARYPDVADNNCPPNQEIDFSEGYQRLILPAEQEERDAEEARKRDERKKENGK